MFCATFGVFMFYTTNRTHSIPTQTTFRFNYTHFKINDQFIPKTGKCLNNQLNGPNVISIFGVFDENVVPMNSLKLHETGLNHDLYCKNSVSLSFFFSVCMTQLMELVKIQYYCVCVPKRKEKQILNIYKVTLTLSKRYHVHITTRTRRHLSLINEIVQFVWQNQYRPHTLDILSILFYLFFYRHYRSVYRLNFLIIKIRYI